MDPIIEQKVRLTARRLGVPEDLAIGVAFNESRGNQSARSPKGAVGVMQLMPQTAAGLGVDPHNEDQNIEGGVRYLKQQLDTFGDPRLAVAAYNAGPGAVQRHGGVPPYAETQKYVGNVMGGQSGADIFGMDAPQGTQGASQSGADIFGMGEPPAGGKPAPAAPPALPPGLGADAAHPIVLTTANRDQIPEGAFFRTSLGEVRQQKKGAGYAPDAPKVPQRTAPMDGVAGLLSGAEKGLAGIADTVLSAGPIGLTGGTMQAAARVGDLFRGQPSPVTLPAVTAMSGVAAANGYKPQTEAGKVMETVGTMLPNAALPGSVPQRVLSVVAPAFGQEAAQRGAKAAGLDENGQNIAGIVGAAAGGLATGLRAGPKGVKLPTADLNALDDAQKAAWKVVNASPYRFPVTDAKAAAADAKRIAMEADPDLYPESMKYAQKLDRMAARGDLTLGKLNTLKSNLGEQLLQPGSREASVAKQISDRIEQLISTAKDPALANAREAYKRFVKVRDVSQRVNDAELARETAGTGGNGNAIRQALKPLIKQRGGQTLRNATPDEKAAISKVVRGTPAQNVLRVATAFDPTAGKLSAMLSGPMALTTGGLSLLGIPVGMAARAGERAIENKNVQALLDLMAAGGKKPTAGPPITWSKAPYAGAAGLTAPFLAAAPAVAQSRPTPKARRP